ncbi:hypothetical protein GA0115253_104502 [Streptomyces sp. Termitarium-T10T-6]|nr:hypothetical protein [Streptomyces sp. Termitarium-T10T-6]SCE34621.1 hypothetical protein GA0115253_104502 [Streptomyces sp. Termitarium-T10T-6]
MLGPRPESSDTATQIARNAAQLADVEPGSDDGKEEAGLEDRLTPQASGRIWASSMGLSFVVPASVGALTVAANLGTLLADQRTHRRRSSRAGLGTGTRQARERHPCGADR